MQAARFVWALALGLALGTVLGTPTQARAQESQQATDAPAPAAQAPTPEELPWGLKNRRYNTFQGSTGGQYPLPLSSLS